MSTSYSGFNDGSPDPGHLFKISIKSPSTRKELLDAITYIVDHIWETNADFVVPNIFFVKWFMSHEGPIMKMVMGLAEKTNTCPHCLGHAAAVAFGVCCRNNEMRLINKHFPGKDDLPEDAHAWIMAHVKELSFMVTGLKLKELGLTCNCAWCCATWYGMSLLNMDTREQTRGQILELKKELDAIEDNSTDEHCMDKILEEACKQFGWDQSKFVCGNGPVPPEILASLGSKPNLGNRETRPPV